MHKATIVGGLVAVALATSVLAPAAAFADDTYDINLHVLSPSGQPVPGVTVSSDEVAGGTTNVNGRLVVHDVDQPPSAVTLCAALDPPTQHLAGPTGWAPVCKQARPPVNGISGLTLQFTVGAAVSGTLVDARTGHPVAQMTVGPYGFGAYDGPWPVTAADGTWTLRNLPTSDGVLHTGDPSHAYTGAPYGYSGFAGAPDGVDVHVTAGATTALGSQPVSPLVQYRGTIADAWAAPIAGATVQVGDVDGDPATPFPPAPGSGYFAAVSATNSQGTYTATLPWTATPNRQVCAYGGIATVQFPTGAALRCQAVNSAALSVTRSLTLAAGGALHGSVTGTTSFLTTVRVRVNGEDVVIVGSSSTDGTYTVRGVPAGRRAVTVITRTTQKTSAAVTVQTGSTTEVPVVSFP